MKKIYKFHLTSRNAGNYTSTSTSVILKSLESVCEQLNPPLSDVSSYMPVVISYSFQISCSGEFGDSDFERIVHVARQLGTLA